jgi:hypothetical protein
VGKDKNDRPEFFRTAAVPLPSITPALVSVAGKINPKSNNPWITWVKIRNKSEITAGTAQAGTTKGQLNQVLLPLQQAPHIGYQHGLTKMDGTRKRMANAKTYESQALSRTLGVPW